LGTPKDNYYDMVSKNRHYRRPAKRIIFKCLVCQTEKDILYKTYKRSKGSGKSCHPITCCGIRCGVILGHKLRRKEISIKEIMALRGQNVVKIYDVYLTSSKDVVSLDGPLV